MSWLAELAGTIAAHGPVVRVSIVHAKGSAPRGAGAAMTVAAEVFTGTIGGGALEHEALHAARAMLSDRRGAATPEWRRSLRDHPLGPSLGQCCGGRVRLLFEVLTAAELAAMTEILDAGALSVGEDLAEVMALRPLEPGSPMEFVHHRKDERDHWPLPLRRLIRDAMSGVRPRGPILAAGWYAEPLGPDLAPLFLYGAGHVGRAAAKLLAELPFEVHWVDTGAERFPDPMPPRVHRLVATDPARAAGHAPAGAWHVVMTFSHAIDLDVCRTVLARGDFAYLGVIASKTKRARFVRRLRDAGLPEAAIARLHAPIGLPGLEGKEPSVIAVSLAADLLLRLQANESAAARRTAQPRLGETGGCS
ncbi:MAG: xanthine dehydrogenase accessory protein XdhC [Alphaproteobacteria bacterium]